METNNEIRNDELKIAMITYKLQNDKESEDYFIEKLKKSYFLIPAVDDDNQIELNCMLLCDQNNNEYFQAYTDKEEYNKWDSVNESKYFILIFDELANIVISSDEEVKGLVINPFSDNITLDKKILKEIFAMDKVLISEEECFPKIIQNKIKKILKKYEKIKKAYLFNIKKNESFGYLLVIDSNSKDKNKLHDQVGKEIIDNIDNINIDIISYNEDLAREITKYKKAFFEK